MELISYLKNLPRGSELRVWMALIGLIGYQLITSLGGGHVGHFCAQRYFYKWWPVDKRPYLMCPGPSGVMSWACRPAYWTFRVSAWPPAGGLVPRQMTVRLSETPITANGYISTPKTPYRRTHGSGCLLACTHECKFHLPSAVLRTLRNYLPVGIPTLRRARQHPRVHVRVSSHKATLQTPFFCSGPRPWRSGRLPEAPR